MIIPGLVSITFRNLTVEEIVDLVVKSELKSIEWGGDVHVPHGDFATAERVADLTERAGLTTAAYGSYYRVGASPAEGLSFQTVLDTAAALNVSTIRVWAGNKGSRQADQARWDAVVSESRQIADLAAAKNVTVAYEFHRNTLTDEPESAKRLLDDVDRDNMLSYWQPPIGADEAACLDGLKLILPKLANLHVYKWVEIGKELDKRPLAEGADEWSRYIQLAAKTGSDHHAMLEFVRDQSTDQFKQDAAALTKIVAAIQKA